MRVVLALLLLLPLLPALLPLAEASAAPEARFALAPALAPAGGAPFAVLVEARGPPGAPVEVKAWVGTATTVISHSFDGLAWVHGSRYAVGGALGADGAWRGALALSAKGEPGDVSLFVRARIGDATGAITSAPLRLVSSGELTPLWSEDALAVARIDGVTVALGLATPDPSGATTPRARVLAPAGATVANATRPPAGRILAAGAGAIEIEVDRATGVCVLAREVACRAVPAGRSSLPLRDARPVTLAVWGEAVETVDPPDVGVLRREGVTWRVRPEGFELQALAPAFERAVVTAFTFPESGLAAFELVAGAASKRLDAWVYTIESEDAAARLVAAADRGARVRLIVEGAPVGGVDPEEARLLAAMAAHGVEVRQLRANGSFPTRFPNIHAKVLIADNATVLVGSENWNAGAMGLRGGAGNRGWGVLVDAPAAAAAFARAFDHDWAGRDAIPLAAVGGARPLPTVAAPALTGPRVASEIRITPVLAPDNALAAILALIESANASLDVQQLFVHPTWDDGTSPLVDALLAASARGVRVRLHLDGRVRDNAQAAEAILARAGGLAFEARVDASGRTIHNKGLVADSTRVLVGSVNWGEASVTRNREVAVIVEDATIAGWFVARFEEDWAGPLGATAGSGLQVATPMPLGVLAAVAFAAFIAARRRSR